MRTRMSAAPRQASESPGPSGAEQQRHTRRPGDVVDGGGLGSGVSATVRESGGAQLFQ